MKYLLPLFLITLAAGLVLWLALDHASRQASAPAVVESYPVGLTPTDLVYGGGHIWVVNMMSNSVSKLTADGHTVGEFPAGTLPRAVAYDGNSIWVSTSLGEVLKLSQEGDTLLKVQLEGILTSIVFDGRFIWVADTVGGAITKILPTGEIEGSFNVGAKPVDLLYDGNHIRVANEGNDTLLKLDVNGQVLKTVHAEQPGALAFDGENLWTTNTGFPYIPGSTVTKFDTEGRMLGVHLTGPNPTDILYADGAIWVANAQSDFNVGGAYVTKLSTEGESLGSFRIGSHPEALAHDGSNLWVLDRADNEARRFDTRSLPHIPPPDSPHLPVPRDPGFPRGLSGSGIDLRPDVHAWLTDFTLHSVPYDEISPGGPARDEILPLDVPSFVTPSEADSRLRDREPVLLLDLDGDARAYPLRFLLWHEIVNDVVAGTPVAVTYCPLCNSAVVLNRTLDGTTYDFGTTGFLRHFDLIMWDRQTESWWQQFTGEAIVGVLTGKRLDLIPSAIIPWQSFRDSHPQGKVLWRDTSYDRPYGLSPYPSFDLMEEDSPTEQGPGGVTLPVMSRVVGVTIDDVSIAFPYPNLAVERVVNRTIGGTEIVIFYEPTTLSPFQDITIDAEDRSVGATGVFSPYVEGRRLTFRFANNEIIDTETHSRWNLLGQAINGPLTGQSLQPILHGDYFWFAWLAFHPTTQVHQDEQ